MSFLRRPLGPSSPTPSTTKWWTLPETWVSSGDGTEPGSDPVCRASPAWGARSGPSRLGNEGRDCHVLLFSVLRGPVHACTGAGAADRTSNRKHVSSETDLSPPSPPPCRGTLGDGLTRGRRVPAESVRGGPRRHRWSFKGDVGLGRVGSVFRLSVHRRPGSTLVEVSHPLSGTGRSAAVYGASDHRGFE